MYEVDFYQIVKANEKESFPNYIYVGDLERALAFASMLNKMSTPEVKFEGIIVEPVKLNDHEKKS